MAAQEEVEQLRKAVQELSREKEHWKTMYEQQTSEAMRVSQELIDIRQQLSVQQQQEQQSVCVWCNCFIFVMNYARFVAMKNLFSLFDNS